jgi:hypothetical protein
MAGMRKADAAAFSEFASARSGSLFRTAYLVMGDYQLAQDLVQESLTKTYLAWPRLRDVNTAEAYTRRVIVRPRSPGAAGDPSASALLAIFPTRASRIRPRSSPNTTSCGSRYRASHPDNGWPWSCATARTCPNGRPLS